MPWFGPSFSPCTNDFKRLDRERRARWRWLVGQARRNRRLTFGAAAVGEVLHDMHGQDGRIFPTHQALAGKAGLSIRAVRYALRSLEDLGLLEWTRRAIGRGRQRRQTSSAFRLLLAGLDTVARLPVIGRVPRISRGCKCCSPKPLGLNSYLETAANVSRQLAFLGEWAREDQERMQARAVSRTGPALLMKG